MKYLKFVVPFAFLTVVLCGCKKGGIKEALFPVSQDIALGQQLADQIAASPTEFPLVDSTKNRELYQAMYTYRDVILQSSDIVYKDEFAWQIKIIDDDQTLNAFAAPGGFIYIYTGIIKFLDDGNHFAGVMGHEIAHADRRHSINQMIKNSGVQLLIEIALGSENGLAQVASGLAGLKFSRTDESDADEWSVRYLCNTAYESNGAAGFFQKLLDQDAAGSQPQFLSTHPSPANRVEDINQTATDLGCTTEGEPLNWVRVQNLASNIVR